MQRTEKYYENDPFLTRAEGRVLASGTDREGRVRLALDGTVFYPEGGGQPADLGVLTLPDGRDLAVVDVHEQGGLIWHTLAPVPDTPCRTLPPAPPDPADRLGLAAGQDAAAHRRAYPFGPAAPDVRGGERGFPHRGRRCADGHQCPHLSGGAAPGGAGRQPDHLAGCAGACLVPGQSPAGGSVLPQQKAH